MTDTVRCLQSRQVSLLPFLLCRGLRKSYHESPELQVWNSYLTITLTLFIALLLTLTLSLTHIPTLLDVDVEEIYERRCVTSACLFSTPEIQYNNFKTITSTSLNFGMIRVTVNTASALSALWPLSALLLARCMGVLQWLSAL